MLSDKKKHLLYADAFFNLEAARPELFGITRRRNERFTGANGLKTSGFTTEVTEIIEFRATDIAEDDDFDLRDLGGMNGEGSFDAATVGNFTNGKRLAGAASATTDDGTFKNLNTFFVTFFDGAVNTNGIAGEEVESLRHLSHLQNR